MEVPTGLSCGWSTELFLDGPSRGCEGGSSHSCPLGLPGLWDLSKAEPLLRKHPGKKGSLCLPLNPRDLKAKLCKALEAKWDGGNKSWVGAGEKVLQNLKGFKSGKCIPERCPGELHWPQQPLICKHGVFPLLFPFLKVPALLVTHSTNISAPLCEPGSMTLKMQRNNSYPQEAFGWELCWITGIHQPHVATESLKCGQCHWGTQIFILFNFNSFFKLILSFIIEIF